MTEETKFNWKNLLIPVAIVIVILLVNYFLNPPEIPDTSKPALSCDSATNICIYPTKTNTLHACGVYIALVAVILFFLFSSMFLKKKAYIMTYKEMYKKIPLDDVLQLKLPPIHEIDPQMIIPKDGGKSCMTRYSYDGKLAYFKATLMSDFRDSPTDFSRRSPIIGWANTLVSFATAQQWFRSDTDTMKKLSEMDRMAESMMGKPLTKELLSERYEEEKKRREGVESGDLQ